MRARSDEPSRLERPEPRFGECYQLCTGYLQRRRDPQHHAQRGLPLTPLELPVVRAIDPGSIRERVLGDLPLSAQASRDIAEGSGKSRVERRGRTASSSSDSLCWVTTHTSKGSHIGWIGTRHIGRGPP